MKTLIEFPTEDGKVVIVEVDEGIEGDMRAARPGEITARAAQTFESALDAIKPVVVAVINKLRDISVPVDQISVEFGIKLGAKAGVYIASADTEANFKVSLTWER